MTVTRFAPSPNGPLHLGHAYSAIVAHDLAREAGGRFLLRIEDIDAERARPELPDEFRRDLEWLGLEWEEVPAQSTRAEFHDLMLAEGTFARDARIYACDCTRAQIIATSTREGPDGPVYPGTCRDKSYADITGEPAFRLNVTNCIAAEPSLAKLTWEDALAGVQPVDPHLFGDIVLQRKDGSPSYHFAVTLDDATDGVTLVTRGADLFPASHVHRLLQGILGLAVPRWHHHPLLLDESGQKLAKRRGSGALGWGLADRRKAGENGRDLAERLRMGEMPCGITLSRFPHEAV
ncbi:Glutamyl-Q tRNA(Asp) synthetase [Erythrobacter sp. EC-HK427]|nr:tRNA glutamyl-Q(34) synthetase GluQRS [Erythrobacter sp. EC-HK427]VVT05020.1 Glutamyl-Q tRNA(Asp) synthetase [Erythrobacter sp. EC-HK427]